MGSITRNAFLLLKSRFQMRDFDGKDLEAIVGAGREKRFAANTVIVDQAHRAEKLFLLLTGRARHFYITETGHKILLRWLVPGDVTGAAALMAKPWRYHLSTEVLTESTLLVWDRITLRELTTRYPEFLRNTLFVLEDYMDWYLTAHIALTCRTGRERCAVVLRSVAHAVGLQAAGGIELAITNEELANAAAITVFEVSRFMSEWQRTGAIIKTRGKVIVRSFDALDEGSDG